MGWPHLFLDYNGMDQHPLPLVSFLVSLLVNFLVSFLVSFLVNFLVSSSESFALVVVPFVVVLVVFVLFLLVLVLILVNYVMSVIQVVSFYDDEYHHKLHLKYLPKQRAFHEMESRSLVLVVALVFLAVHLVLLDVLACISVLEYFQY